jgi:hypothetical protein
LFLEDLDKRPSSKFQGVAASMSGKAKGIFHCREHFFVHFRYSFSQKKHDLNTKSHFIFR